MIQKFYTHMLDDDGNLRTQTIDGHKDILVKAKNHEYTYGDMQRFLAKAFETERTRYGWEMKFVDGDDKKEMFIRSLDIEKINATTKHNQTIEEWVDYLYDRNIEQINLF